MAILPVSDRGRELEASLQGFDRFDKRVKKLLLPYRKGKHALSPNQAERVIMAASKRFGKEALLWTFDHFRHRFISKAAHRPDEVYPESQIRVFEEMAGIHIWAAIYALRKLHFYDQGDVDDPLHLKICCRDLSEGDVFDTLDTKQEFDLGTEDVLRPIFLMGDRFGEWGAVMAVEEARNHIYMRDRPDFRNRIEEYFRNNFDPKSAERIKEKLKYKSHWSDWLKHC
jgi:hypothetical protein